MKLEGPSRETPSPGRAFLISLPEKGSFMTPEQRAEIARRNGAKSRGPVTAEGKLHSSRNGIKYGKYASTRKYFVPPPEACESNRTRQAYFSLLDSLLEVFRPVNDIGYNIVREIAVATWQYRQLTATHMILVNRECDRLAAMKSSADLEAFSGEGFLSPRLTGEIDRLHRRIAQLERRFVFNRDSITPKRKRIVSVLGDKHAPMQSDVVA
jgi:hypothetical protein